jgi:hypothetical protein
MRYSTWISYSCTAVCQQVHARCWGCGVLEGPEHLHLLRAGYCFELLHQDESTGEVGTVPIVRSCWNLRHSFGARRTPWSCSLSRRRARSLTRRGS